MKAPNSPRVGRPVTTEEIKQIFKGVAKEWSVADGPINVIAAIIGNGGHDFEAVQKQEDARKANLARKFEEIAEAARALKLALLELGSSGDFYSSVINSIGLRGFPHIVELEHQASIFVNDLTKRKYERNPASGKVLMARGLKDLSIQAWEAGGTPFFRGSRRNFGIHANTDPKGSPLVQVVMKLMALAGVRTNVSWLVEWLPRFPDPMPWDAPEPHDQEYVQRYFDRNGRRKPQPDSPQQIPAQRPRGRPPKNPTRK